MKFQCKNAFYANSKPLSHSLCLLYATDHYEFNHQSLSSAHQHLLLFSAKILTIAITSQDEQFFVFNQPHSDAN